MSHPPLFQVTVTAAQLYILLESAKLGGVEPKLTSATPAALANRHAVTLPHDLLR